jgi:hypothetical protein
MGRATVHEHRPTDAKCPPHYHSVVAGAEAVECRDRVCACISFSNVTPIAFDTVNRLGQCVRACVRVYTGTNGTLCLGSSADREAGLVNKGDNGQVKRVTQPHEARKLAAGVCAECAAVVCRIRCQHTHRPAIKARKARDQRPVPSPSSAPGPL